MPSKKKASEVAGPSASNPPAPEQTGGGEGTGGGTGVVEPAHGATASEHAPRPSQEARDRQRRGAHSTIRSLDQERGGVFWDAKANNTRKLAGGRVVRSPGPGPALSNIVGSPTPPPPPRHPPPLPATPAEAL